MEFNPSNQRLFQACLATERARPNEVVYPDRFMDIFGFCDRWGREMQLEMMEDSTKTVADVADTAAFKAGPESSDTWTFIATASVIMIKCWKYGEDLYEWFKKSRYCDYLDNPSRLVFPLYYLYVPTDAHEATIGWEWEE
jgi:hypothetical protein